MLRRSLKTLLEIGVVEPLVRQRLDLADGREIHHVVAREPLAVDHEAVGVEAAAGPADQLVEIGIDRQVEAAEMDGAALHAAGDVGNVVRDVGGAEVEALVGETVMPLVEPFRKQPFGRALVLGAGERVRARQGERNGGDALQQQSVGSPDHGRLF